jgi:hypothetical protein
MSHSEMTEISDDEWEALLEDNRTYRCASIQRQRDTQDTRFTKQAREEVSRKLPRDRVLSVKRPTHMTRSAQFIGDKYLGRLDLN